MKLINYIKLFLASIQKAAIAAHFARMGQVHKANDVISRV